MWLDELSHRCAFAGKPVGELLRYPVSLSYLLTKLCDSIYWHDGMSRLPSVLGAVLVVLGAYWTVAQCGCRYVGVVAAWAVLWNPYFSSVALQNRFYSLGAGLMLCVWALGRRVARQISRGLVVGYSVVSFLAMHAWPWGAPWVAGVNLLLTYELVVREWQRPPAQRNWWRCVNDELLIWMPVIFFGLHYVLIGGEVHSISKTANDGFWRAPQTFTVSYVREMLISSWQGAVQLEPPYLMAAFAISMTLLLLLRPLAGGAFAVLTLAVWAAAVYFCNQARVVPIPRRIVFTQIHATLLLFMGWSALADQLTQWGGWDGLRTRRLWWWVVHVLVAALVGCGMLVYGWDRMIVTRGREALNHGPAYKAMAAIVRRYAVRGACVVSLEDGNGVAWGVTSYVIRPRPARNDLVHHIRYLQFSQLPDVTELQAMAAVHTQIWVVGDSRRLPAATERELERSGVCFPFEKNVWWYEPAIATWDTPQRIQHIRMVIVRLVQEMPPVDISAHAMTNLLALCSDEDLQRHLRLLLARRAQDKDEAFVFARLLSRYGLHDAAIRAVQSPLYCNSRHTSMYEWIAGRLIELACTVPRDARHHYIAAAQACLRAAIRRGSPTASATLQALTMEGEIVRKKISPRPQPVLGRARGLLWHTSFDHNVSVTPLTTNLPALNRARSFTAIVLVRCSATDIQIPLGQGYGSSCSNSPWFLVVSPPQNHVGFAVQFVDHGEQRVGYPWQPQWTNAWLCLAGVYDDVHRCVRLYVNGMCLGVAEAPPGPRITLDLPVGVGALSHGGYPLHGNLAEAAIYGRALSDREISRLLRPLILTPPRSQRQK